MQDRYAGDIGDYVKLALLRALSTRRQLGIAWYIYPDEKHNADGRHIAYLSDPVTWRHLDPSLFDLLEEVVRSGRSVAALKLAFTPKTLFADEILPSGLKVSEREDARKHWFHNTVDHLTGCDLVFADPDNGLVADELWRWRASSFGKQMPLSEARVLAADRCAVVYHHNSRFKGGHDAEVNHWMEAVGMPAIAVRATAYSCRTFFILNPDQEIRERAEEFCQRWAGYKVRLHESNRSAPKSTCADLQL